MAKDDRIRGNAFTRGAKIASLPASYAARTTFGWGKRVAGAPAQSVLSDVQRRTAEQLFAVLGGLKGGAMKFGQSLSVFEAALPEEFAGPYREALTKLQDAAPPMSPATVTRVMTDEFGSNWPAQFPDFTMSPAASASIGQVHRSGWIDPDTGQRHEVAVKLQYPGADKALLSDLKQIARIARLIGVVAPGLDMGAMVTELRARVVEELDYRLEALTQNLFAKAFADDQRVVIPRAYVHTQRALVTQWLESDRSMADVIKTGSQEERNRLGVAMVRFMFDGPARAGLLHADPHPGNFRILADGRLGVVDFGAVARLPDGLPPAVGPLLKAATLGDYATVIAGLRTEGFIRPDIDVDEAAMQSYLEPLVEPLMTENFTFSRDWLRAQGQRLASRAPDGFGAASKLTIPPSYLMIHRVWMGGVGVLCQLNATAPFRSIVGDALPGFAEDPQE